MRGAHIVLKNENSIIPPLLEMSFFTRQIRYAWVFVNPNGALNVTECSRTAFREGPQSVRKITLRTESFEKGDRVYLTKWSDKPCFRAVYRDPVLAYDSNESYICDGSIQILPATWV